MKTQIITTGQNSHTLLVFTVLLTCLLALSACGPASATATPAPTLAPGSTTLAPTTPPDAGFQELIPIAQTFVDQLVQGDFAAAGSRFTAAMTSAMPTAKLKDTWQQLLLQTGAFQKQLGTQTLELKGYKIVLVTCQFEKAVIDVQVTFDAQNRIGGLFFKPGQASLPTLQAYAAPAYVKIASFTEREVTVGSGTWALPGTLTLPEGPGPFPAVVLVHGSGPNDRDETIGPNQPFRDLAWGLASQSIAVLRYDKRTLVHKAQFTPEIIARLTLKEETIDDALLAAQLLRQTPGIDPKHVFVLGHSLGATAAPRIGQQDPALAGLIVMAGMTIPFEDEILRQIIYLNSLTGTPSAAQRADVETLKTQVARVKDPALSEQTPATDLPLGITPAYWLDLRGYQPAELAKSLTMPILVLQGERDYQVTPELDYKGWQTALSGKANATLKLYPGLNHLFISGTGQPNPQEYNSVGHVSPVVIEDIAKWVKQN